MGKLSNKLMPSYRSSIHSKLAEWLGCDKEDCSAEVLQFLQELGACCPKSRSLRNEDFLKILETLNKESHSVEKMAESIKRYKRPKYPKRNTRKYRKIRTVPPRSKTPLDIEPVDLGAPRRCPHGVLKPNICAICQPKRYKFWYGDE